MSTNATRALFCATLLALPTVPALATTVNGDYRFTIVSQDRAIQGNETYSDGVLLEDGSVAIVVRDIGNRSNVRHRIRIVSPDGTVAREVLAPPGTDFGGTPGGGLAVNARGQIVASAFRTAGSSGGVSRDARRRLLLIEPDGTIRTLIDAPAIQPAGVADPTVGSFAALRINEAGEVAVGGTARLADGSTEARIVKIGDTSSAAPTFQILDRTTGAGTDRSTFVSANDIALDEAGQVAWTRSVNIRDGSGPSGDFVFVSDGDPPQVVLQSTREPNNINYRVSDLTESELLAVVASGNPPGTGVGTSDVSDTDPGDPATFVEDFTSRTFGGQSFDANEFGQAVGQSNNDGIALDGEFIASLGDMVGPFSIGAPFGAASPEFRASSGQFLNDAGQIAFLARGTIFEDTPDLDRGAYNLVIRADPIGSTPDHIILPFAQEDDVASVSYEIVNALGLTTPIYVDPDPAERFDYLLNSGPLITKLVIPNQALGAEDGLFDILFGGFSESLAFGEILDFTTFAGFGSGVSAFSIAGIDIGSDVMTDDPFVVGLTHAGLGAVDLTITGRPAQTAPIPLPAGMWLLLSGLGLVFMTGRRAATASDRI
jgi:hypothetical protein